MLRFPVAQGSKAIITISLLPTESSYTNHIFKYKKRSLMKVYFVLFIPVYLCVDDRRNTTFISSAFFTASCSDNLLLSFLTWIIPYIYSWF